MGKNYEEKEFQRLVEDFRKMGAFDPESWARSEFEEDIPQFARFVFLRQAWTNVVAEDDATWIDGLIGQSKWWPRGPGAGAGPALERALAAGVSREDIVEVVRVMQWQILHDIAYQLADSSVVEYLPGVQRQVNWMLFEVDDDNIPLHPINQLHESVLDTEPSGREMRPKGVDRNG